MRRKSFLLFFLMSLPPLIGVAKSQYGDDVVEIVIEKGGQLESKLKKENALNTKKLSVLSPEKYSSAAVLNEKDFLFLSGMNQLEELYVDADIDGNKFNYHKFIQKNGTLTNANFPNIKKIGFGQRTCCEVKDLFSLKVKGLVADADDSYQSLPLGIIFEDLYISSKPESGVGGFEGSNGFLDSRGNWLVLDADFYGHKDGYARLSRQPIHAIYVESRDWLDSELCSTFNPAVIYIHTPNSVEKYLANYNSDLHEEDKDLSQYDGILTGALSNCSFETLILPEKQEIIPDRFFENSSIEHLDINKVRTLGKNAFYGSHIKEISLPSSVQDIHEKSFNNSELTVVYMEGEYPPAINVNYVPEGLEKVQFIIPKGTRENYNIGAWKKLRVLEDGATTDYAFDVKNPGTLSSLLTDDIKQRVVSLKLRGILFSDDIKLLEDCPNLRFLDLGETFIAQSPKELKEQQEISDYLLGTFMGMGIIAQSEYEHDRMSALDNLQVQYLAKLAEMAKDEKIQSDPKCQIPVLNKTGVEELILPLQLQRVYYSVFPKNLKKIVLPPDLREFEASPYTSLSEIVLPRSVQKINIKSSNIKYADLQSIDMSACENPTIELDAEFKNLHTLKFPASFIPIAFNGGKTMEVWTFVPIDVYFKGRELQNRLNLSAPTPSKIFIPKGSRAGYASLIDDRFEIIEQ